MLCLHYVLKPFFADTSMRCTAKMSATYGFQWQQEGTVDRLESKPIQRMNFGLRVDDNSAQLYRVSMKHGRDYGRKVCTKLTSELTMSTIWMREVQ